MSACFAPKNIWQSPPNAHAYRLLIFKDLPKDLSAFRFNPLQSAKPCIVAQNFPRLNVFTFSSKLYTRSKAKKKTSSVLLDVSDKSLTMTYFHTGIRTIIGAKSFHCPVRDGKEWGQLAMVIRHNFLPGSRSCDLWWLPKRIHRVCKSFWGLLAISVLFDCADLSR